MNYLRRAWQGQEKPLKVFLTLGVSAVPLLLSFGFIATLFGFGAVGAFILLTVGYVLVVAVMLLRNAKNAQSKPITRLIQLVTLLLVGGMIYGVLSIKIVKGDPDAEIKAKAARIEASPQITQCIQQMTRNAAQKKVSPKEYIEANKDWLQQCISSGQKNDKPRRH